jgi:hypothetical protein
VPESPRVVADTRAWVERVVIGLGLCPFAARPFREERIRYAVAPGAARDTVYRACLAEMLRLLEHPSAELETTLVIVPRGLAAFDDYLDLLGALEEALDASGLRGILQIASFHPDYRFAGTSASDPANYTNRSPYPMFHLLREASLAAALDAHPEPQRIPTRNAARLRELGAAKIVAVAKSGLADPG